MASLPSLAAILKRRQKTSARPFTLLNANLTGAKERTGLGTNAVRVTLGEHRGQTLKHAQCTRTRSPAAKISRAKI